MWMLARVSVLLKTVVKVMVKMEEDVAGRMVMGEE